MYPRIVVFGSLFLSIRCMICSLYNYYLCFSCSSNIYLYCPTGLFLGYFYPLATSAIVFLAFYAILNFYVWTLAFAYAPLGSEEGYSKGPTAFGEDYFDECGGLAEGQDVMGLSDNMFEI